MKNDTMLVKCITSDVIVAGVNGVAYSGATHLAVPGGGTPENLKPRKTHKNLKPKNTPKALIGTAAEVEGSDVFNIPLPSIAGKPPSPDTLDERKRPCALTPMPEAGSNSTSKRRGTSPVSTARRSARTRLGQSLPRYCP